ncbi:MAG: transcription antitermination factor NusB [Thermovirgaceae bacterium]
MKRGLLPQKRRRSREIALQVLYSLDLREDTTVEEAISLFPFPDEDPEVVGYAQALIRGVVERNVDIDRLLRAHITGWRPERMVVVDRVAIRLALYEGVILGRIPVAVAISEAVELAKRFGTEESGRFVNGVLGRIVRGLEEDDTNP